MAPKAALRAEEILFLVPRGTPSETVESRGGKPHKNIRRAARGSAQAQIREKRIKSGMFAHPQTGGEAATLPFEPTAGGVGG